MPSRFAAASAAAIVLSLSAASAADDIADFYKDSTVTFLVAQGAGGGYDHYARLLAGHIKRHIPGNPGTVVQHMPGAAGVKGTNYLYNVAPKDGSVIGIVPYALAHIQLLRGKVKYDAAKLIYVGRMTSLNGMLMVWSHAPATTLAALKTTEVIMAAGGMSGQSYMNPTLMRALLGLKLKVVPGYNGGSAVMDMAIERGEAHGRVGVWADMVAQRKAQVDSGQIIPLIEVGLARNEFSPPGVPLIGELAKTEDDRKLLEFMASSSAIGRVFALPPGTPTVRVTALRRAFDATMKDPALLEEAKRRRFGIDPLSGEEVQKVVENSLKIPPALIERARAAFATRN